MKMLVESLATAQTGVTIVGGVLIVWGIIQLALGFKNHQGTQQEAGGFCIVSGLMVEGAAAYLGTLATT